VELGLPYEDVIDHFAAFMSRVEIDKVLANWDCPACSIIGPLRGPAVIRR